MFVWLCWWWQWTSQNSHYVCVMCWWFRWISLTQNDSHYIVDVIVLMVTVDQSEFPLCLCDCVDGSNGSVRIPIMSVWLCWWFEWISQNSHYVCVIVLMVRMDQSEFPLCLCDCVDGSNGSVRIPIMSVWLCWWFEWISQNSHFVCVIVLIVAVDQSDPQYVCVIVLMVQVDQPDSEWFSLWFWCDCVDGDIGSARHSNYIDMTVVWFLPVLPFLPLKRNFRHPMIPYFVKL